MRCRRSRSSSSTMGGGAPGAGFARVTCLARIVVLPPPNGTSGFAADQRAHLGAQVPRMERLADEVGSADLHGGDAVAHVRAAGQEQDGHVARLRLSLQDLAQLPAVEAGQGHPPQPPPPRPPPGLAPGVLPPPPPPPLPTPPPP